MRLLRGILFGLIALVLVFFGMAILGGVGPWELGLAVAIATLVGVLAGRRGRVSQD